MKFIIPAFLLLFLFSSPNSAATKTDGIQSNTDNNPPSPVGEGRGGVAGRVFSWRGAMLDLSRHYFPLQHVYRQVDALAQVGINRLHLHLTDAQGWRMEIKAYPRLTTVAAWRTDCTLDEWWDGDRAYGGSYGGFYTQDELRELVHYADSRGVTLVPEIEMPGHSEEVFAAYPELLCEGGTAPLPAPPGGRANGPANVTASPLGGTGGGAAQADFCAGNELTFTFLTKVLDEVMDVFTSPYIHIGGDEAARRLWDTCGRCQKRMKEHGFETTAQMQAWFMRRICDYVTAKGRTPVVWDEVMEGWKDVLGTKDDVLGTKDDVLGTKDDVLGTKDEVARDSSLIHNTSYINPIIMCWRGQDKAEEAVKQGFKVILCPGSHCYFDCAQDAPYTQPVSSGGYLPLSKVYSYDPTEGISEHQDLIIGLQGNVWAEHIATPAHAEYMLYPRIMALAEIGMGRRYDYATFRQKAIETVRSLRAQGYNAFDLEHEVGERPERDTEAQHLARGCTVTYNAPFNSYYHAADEATLTDGVRGGWANNDGRWQGFIGRRGMDVTIDLGAVKEVSSITACFPQICQPDIYAPAEFIVSMGTTPDNISEVFSYSAHIERTFTPTITRREWTGHATTRYIRIQALPGKKYGGWIFCDEIEVN